MGFDEDFDKLAIEANINHWAYIYGALGVPNLVVQTEGMQEEGSNKSDGFSGYLSVGEEYRTRVSSMIAEHGVAYLEQWLVDIIADTILSNNSDMEAILIDLKEWMHTNTKTVKTRAMTKGTWTPGQTMGNKATLYIYSTDWLGYDIETGKGGYTWNMTCTIDKHLSTSYEYSGLMECKSDIKIENYFIGEGVVANYNFIAMSGESSGNIIKNNQSFADFYPTAAVKYTGWYSPDWTNISQDTTVYFHYRIGSRDSINRDGLGESCIFTDNAEMWYYLDDVDYSKYFPYQFLQRYKYSTDCDGTNTLYLGSQSQASPVDGEPAAFTGTMGITLGSTVVSGNASAFIKEFKVGDLIWNDTDDTIVDAGVVASINSDISITLVANYTGTTRDPAGIASKHCGWHDLEITKVLSDFVEDQLKLGFKLTGNTAGTIYFDDMMHRELIFYPELARFGILVAGQTDLVEGDTISLADSIAAEAVVQRYFAMNIESDLIPLSLPHDAAPSNADPTKTRGTVEFNAGPSVLVDGVGTKFTEDFAVGDWIWNDTDDDLTDAQQVLSVGSDVQLTLAAVYLGTTGAAGKVCGVHRY